MDSSAVVLPNHRFSAGDYQCSVASIIRGGEGRSNGGIPQIILPSILAGAIEAVQIALVIDCRNEQVLSL